jgi:hypothetical protein
LLEWTSDTLQDAEDAEALTELPCLATFERTGTA